MPELRGLRAFDDSRRRLYDEWEKIPRKGHGGTMTDILVALSSPDGILKKDTPFKWYMRVSSDGTAFERSDAGKAIDALRKHLGVTQLHAAQNAKNARVSARMMRGATKFMQNIEQPLWETFAGDRTKELENWVNAHDETLQKKYGTALNTFSACFTAAVKKYFDPSQVQLQLNVLKHFRTHHGALSSDSLFNFAVHFEFALRAFKRMGLQDACVLAFGPTDTYSTDVSFLRAPTGEQKQPVPTLLTRLWSAHKQCDLMRSLIKFAAKKKIPLPLPDELHLSRHLRTGERSYDQGFSAYLQRASNPACYPTRFSKAVKEFVDAYVENETPNVDARVAKANRVQMQIKKALK